MPESNRSASPVRRRAAVGAFARGLLIFSQKQTIPVGLVYLPVQRVSRARDVSVTSAARVHTCVVSRVWRCVFTSRLSEIPTDKVLCGLR